MNWHERYRHQAAWTRELRAYAFERCGWSVASRVLEVGCGTGAVLSDPAASGPAAGGPQLHGLDISAAALTECCRHAPGACLTRGDVRALPYAGATFDITFCHYLLLWVDQPLRALQEMKRVTAPSGYVLALAEPDYLARVDQPAELAWLGGQQNEALRSQGAALHRGAELAGLFDRAGLRIIETGTIRPQNADDLRPAAWESEWQVLEADLAGALPDKELSRLHALAQAAARRGERLVSVPTYFAWGQV